MQMSPFFELVPPRYLWQILTVISMKMNPLDILSLTTYDAQHSGPWNSQAKGEGQNQS